MVPDGMGHRDLDNNNDPEPGSAHHKGSLKSELSVEPEERERYDSVDKTPEAEYIEVPQSRWAFETNLCPSMTMEHAAMFFTVFEFSNYIMSLFVYIFSFLGTETPSNNMLFCYIEQGLDIFCLLCFHPVLFYGVSKRKWKACLVWIILMIPVNMGRLTLLIIHRHESFYIVIHVAIIMLFELFVFGIITAYIFECRRFPHGLPKFDLFANPLPPDAEAPCYEMVTTTDCKAPSAVRHIRFRQGFP